MLDNIIKKSKKVAELDKKEHPDYEEDVKKIMEEDKKWIMKKKNTCLMR